MLWSLKILLLIFLDCLVHRVRRRGIAKTAGWGKMSCGKLPDFIGHNDKTSIPVRRRHKFPLDMIGDVDLQVRRA